MLYIVIHCCIFVVLFNEMEYFTNISNYNEARLIYRRLAMLNHPDRGGSTEVMKRINIEFMELERKLNNKDLVFSDISVGDHVLINSSESVVISVNNTEFIARSLYTSRIAKFSKRNGECISDPKFKATSLIILNHVG